jgi:hypothetical protein
VRLLVHHKQEGAQCWHHAIALHVVVRLTRLLAPQYEEVAAEMQRVLVFRAGSFDADFVLGNVRRRMLRHTLAGLTLARGSQACGEGGNGECFVVHRRNVASVTRLCVKVPRNNGTSDMQKEVDLMRALGDCEYIVQFVAYYREGEGANLRQHIVMEVRRSTRWCCVRAAVRTLIPGLTRRCKRVSQLMEGGDLYKHLTKRVQDRGDTVAGMADAEVRQVTWRMLKGLQHMHDMKMMHRDIKLDNVLLATLGDDGFGDPATAKLSDFGTSRQLGADLSRAHTLRLGTVAYGAPEIAAALLPGGVQAGYTNAADLWSVGVTLYAMLVQVYPCGSARWSNDLPAQGVRCVARMPWFVAQAVASFAHALSAHCCAAGRKWCRGWSPAASRTSGCMRQAAPLRACSAAATLTRAAC